jgi:hypothetical protein
LLIKPDLAYADAALFKEYHLMVSRVLFGVLHGPTKALVSRLSNTIRRKKANM